MTSKLLCLLSFLAVATAATTPAAEPFSPLDIFELEWASDPRISPDSESIAYVRNYMDVMTDRRCANIWIVATGDSDNRPLTGGVRLQQLHAGDVRRHHVRRELDAVELPGEDFRHRLDEQRLRESRHSHDQNVAFGEDRREQRAYGVVLADDHLADFLSQSNAAFCGL